MTSAVEEFALVHIAIAPSHGTLTVTLAVDVKLPLINSCVAAILIYTEGARFSSV
jgi:hypothetical protein